jgi:hypothetical protein
VPQGKKADEVDHSGNDAEQRRQAALQPRRFLSVIRRDPVLKRGGTSSERRPFRRPQLVLFASTGY